MSRKFKALGLAMLAVFAMSAVAAQGASAASSLTAESYPVTLTGTQTNIHKFQLTALGLSTECEISKFTGTSASAAAGTAVTVHPAYEKCKAFGLSATIDTEGCDFIVHPGATLAADKYTGTIDVECSGANVIKITAGIIGNRCEVQVGSQTGLSSGEAVNNTAASPKDIDLTAAVTGITYKITKDEGTCPLSKVGETFSDGDYNGSVTIKGSSGIFISDE